MAYDLTKPRRFVAYADGVQHCTSVSLQYCIKSLGYGAKNKRWDIKDTETDTIVFTKEALNEEIR